MKLLDCTWPSPEENLACDEALLDACVDRQIEPTLRLWQPTRFFVALGYGCQTNAEVDQMACRRLDIPILRRCSGGGTVLQGPGCLNYALVLPAAPDSPFATIAQTNRFVMEQHRQLIASLLQQPVQIQGVTDLTIHHRKFSGNAQRRKQDCLLFHGSFLLDLDLDLMERVLLLPKRQPAYRGLRPHHQFLTPIPVKVNLLKTALQQTWQAHQSLQNIPSAQIDRLVQEKYRQAEWNRRR